MGCQMLVAAQNESREAEERLNQVPEWFANWENSLSRFKPDSELNLLNQQAGSQVKVNTTIWEVMLSAIKAWHESDGLVNPCVLPALERSGYVRSFEHIGGVVMTNKDVMRTSIQEMIVDIQLDAEERSILMPKDMRLDFGGVAKGWSAHQAMSQLVGLGPVLVDAGGDIAISEPLEGNAPWAIGVNDPLNRGFLLETLYVREGGVATSGRDHRHWLQDGEMKHHIIDPRTGEPAKTDLLSATVIANTVMEAEMAAKVVLILGSDAGLDWLDQRPHVTGMAVLENGDLLGSHGIEDYLRN